MDDLLREFLTETSENQGTVGMELVRFEQQPNNVEILNNLIAQLRRISGAATRIDRAARGLAAKLDKPIDLEKHGPDNGLDRQVLPDAEAMFASLQV